MQSKQHLELGVEFGNAGDMDTNGTGWFVGFSEWTRHPPSHLRHVPATELAAGLCVKWFSHPAGKSERRVQADERRASDVGVGEFSDRIQD